MRRAQKVIAAVSSAGVDTPWGPVQYVDHGTGIPMLMGHGIFGGHPDAVELVDLYAGPGYRTIGPSRFGYLGSALPAGATPADQADAYVALLDHLDVDKVLVVGFSAGSPSAIQLSLRHPDRVLGLILASAYLPGTPPLTPLLHPLVRRSVGRQWVWWALKRWMPGTLSRIMGVPKGYVLTPDDQWFVDHVKDSLFPVTAKRDGATFDVLVSEPASNAYPLEEIGVPTLLVHSTDDPLAKYENAVRAAARIPSARLVTMPAGGHLFLGHADRVRVEIGAFANAVARREATRAGGPA